MEERLQKIRDEALKTIPEVKSREEWEALRIKYLGRKGILPELLKQMGGLPAELKPRIGQLANAVKKDIEAALNTWQARVSSEGQAGPTGPKTDITLPGRFISPGKLHPITQITGEVCDIFERLGFAMAEGPDVELDYYNFEALNIPRDHPARDMQDTFYISENVLLRTHTSPIQVRTMERQRPPVRIIAPGKVYRCDSDITHTPMFHQVEGFMVDKGVSFADLKGILTIFIHQIFDEQTSLRFRPSFFPFTEPSAEIDILCVICRGSGCRVCSQTGWLEVMGAGMVDPEVFRMVGYDPEEITGLAFGMGIERIAMLKYGIDDIRLFYENNLRFLNQF
ncbi:MAG: phenylalanine--tRNA ligase subunit alpha [Thermodesulfobacteriota bacterium]|nr:phenylalanine--tRNA ligase subunit alpha [Thermodesulfobacteriota bacterium]